MIFTRNILVHLRQVMFDEKQTHVALVHDYSKTLKYFKIIFALGVLQKTFNFMFDICCFGWSCKLNVTTAI